MVVSVSCETTIRIWKISTWCCRERLFKNTHKGVKNEYLMLLRVVPLKHLQGFEKWVLDVVESGSSKTLMRVDFQIHTGTPSQNPAPFVVVVSRGWIQKTYGCSLAMTMWSTMKQFHRRNCCGSTSISTASQKFTQMPFS